MKKARIEQGITYDDIVDMTRKAGTPVSISSIKRVFTAGGEFKDFRDETTLIPIARTLLTPEEIREVLTVNSGNLDTNYQIIIKMKEEMIDVLNREIQKLDQNGQEKDAYFKKELKRLRTILWCLVAFSALLIVATVIAFL